MRVLLRKTTSLSTQTGPRGVRFTDLSGLEQAMELARKVDLALAGVVDQMPEAQTTAGGRLVIWRRKSL
jgi:hypothetical protein